MVFRLQKFFSSLLICHLESLGLGIVGPLCNCFCARGRSHWQKFSKKGELLAGLGTGRRYSIPFGLYSHGGICTQSVLSLVSTTFSYRPPKHMFSAFFILVLSY